MKPSLPAVAVLVCAWLNITGWLLSALHRLDLAGYAASLALFLLAVWYWQRHAAAPISSRYFSGKKFNPRFRRPLPAVFLLVAGLVFVGGTLYAPANFDALTYRLPRLLNWQVAGQWFWISSFNERMNYSGTAWEWIAMPFLIFTHSDRGMFLINALGFLLLPGLLFSISRQLGVARKVAWTWMWLLPLAYGLVTQAGSIGNDLMGALFCLLSLHFGLRARRSGRISDVWLALLAAALLTGVKLSNLPLALPCLVAVWPALGQLRKNVTGSLAVVAGAAVVSALPIMAWNHFHAGSWTGDPQNQYRMQLANPVAGLLGNSFLLTEQSLMPPILPGSIEINQRLTELLPISLKEQFFRLRSNRFTEFPGEEGSGLGLGVTLPLLLVLGAAVMGRGRTGSKPSGLTRLPPVALATWVAALVYMAKMGSEAGPRLLLPYYLPAIIPFLLLPAQGFLLRQRWWRLLLAIMAASVLPAQVLSVSRPLWPAQTVSQKLAQTHPDNPLLQRLAATYTTYAHRNDLLAPIRAALPETAREIGFIAGSNDAEYSLWRPFGGRKVKHLRPTINRFLENPEIEWVVVKENVWPEITSVTLVDWASAHHAEVVLSMPITELVSWGPENWCLLHIEQPADSSATLTRPK